MQNLFCFLDLYHVCRLPNFKKVWKNILNLNFIFYALEDASGIGQPIMVNHGQI